MNAKDIVELMKQADAAARELEIAYLKEFGQNVAELRKKNGITQDELSKRLKLGRASVANIEAGRQDPTISRIPYFCAAFNCSPIDLLPKV